MAKEFAERFYNSSLWKKCRKAFISERISIDGGLCQVCKDVTGYIVHHKITLDATNIVNPDISLNFDNLMYVCKDCHDRFEGHGVGTKLKPLCVFDASGQPISLRDIDVLPP